MLASIVIRTYNEERHLAQVLDAVSRQQLEEDFEVIIVDSGSTDDTLAIASRYGCRITSIEKEQFTFGRSLNVGCEFADGELLVFLSGHCIPKNEHWLHNLLQPIVDGVACYCYGQQLGGEDTKFSEAEVFSKYYPQSDLIPQAGFFCNNANAAIEKRVWRTFRFNEDLTGLEDMYLAKQLVVAGQKIAYASGGAVYHLHNESWRQIRLRYEREAIALREIMPEVSMSMFDFVVCVLQSVYHDYGKAAHSSMLLRVWREVLFYRCCQYWGAFVGHHDHRKLSLASKRKYFYPREKVEEASRQYDYENSSSGST